MKDYSHKTNKPRTRYRTPSLFKANRALEVQRGKSASRCNSSDQTRWKCILNKKNAILTS